MAIFIAIAVGFAAAGYYQAKKAQKAAKKAAEDMAGILYTKESTIESVPVIYGERRTGGTRVFVETKPYFSGDKHNKELYMAIVLSEGEVESISDIWIDDKPLSKYAQYFGSIALDLGTYAQVGGDQEIYIQKFLGTDNQAASSVLQEAPSWGANHKLSGFAYLAVRLRWNDEAFQGIPDISAVVKGRKVYDPRTSTTAYTTNAALCLRDYLLNDRFGKGLPSDSIDEAAFIQAANDIDSFTITPYVGAPTNIKLFELHAAIKTDEELFQNVEKILMSCRGFLPYRDGKYGLTIDQSSSPVMTIDSDMIIGGINIDGGKKDDRFNIVEVKFPNKQLDYNVDTAFWPDPSSSTPTSFSDGQGGYLTEAELHAQFVAEDLGHVLKDDVDLECVTNYYAARDMARIFCLRSRNDLGVKIKCTSEATDLVVGDVVAITHPTPAWTAKPFQVESVTLEDDGTVSLQLLEYASNIYAYDPANEERDYPDTELPDPFVVLPPQSVTASNVSALLEDGTLLPRMEVNWTDADDAFVEEYEIRYKLTTATTYEYVRSRTTERIVEGIKTGTYNVGVRSINSMGVKSAWEDGANIQLTKDTTKPQDIATLTATAGARQVTLSWANPADVDYKQTRIYQNTTNSVPTAHSYVVTGDTFVVTGLTPDQDYYFWAENEDYAGNIAQNKTASGVVTPYKIDLANENNSAGWVDADGAAAAAPVQSVAGLTGSVLVADIITEGALIVAGDNVSSLTNDAGYTTFDAGDVEAAIANNVTVIDGAKITTGTVATARLDVDDIIATGEIVIGKIGGRNLIPRSSYGGTQTTDKDGGNFATVRNMSSSVLFRVATQWVEHDNNVAYSTSFWAKASVATTAQVDWCDTNSKSISLTTDWQYFEFPNVTIDSVYMNQTYNGFFDISLSATANIDITVSHLKIEKGQNVTAWSPAIEDSVLDGNTNVNLGLTGGSVGGITISSTKLYSGAGNFNSADTGFYLDSTGKFSLDEKLSFNPATDTLTVDGSIKAINLDLTGNANIAGDITATAVTAGSITYDMLSPETKNAFQADVAESIGGTNGDFESATGSLLNTITLPVFSHGGKPVEITLSGSKTGYHYTSYDAGERTANYTVQRATNATFTSGLTTVTSGSIVANEYDLSDYYGGASTFYHSVSFSVSVEDNPAQGDYYYRVTFSAGGTPSFFSDSNCTTTANFAANEAPTGVTSSGGNADTLDNLDSTKFMRTDEDTSTTGNLTVGGDLSVTGDLNITGNINSYNVTDLDVSDVSITLNAGGAALTADGAGIYIEKAVDASTDASITWNATNDEFDFSHNVTAPNLNILNWNTAYGWGDHDGLYLPKSAGSVTLTDNVMSRAFRVSVSGNFLTSAFRFTCSTDGGGYVAATTFDVIVNHYQDIYIEASSGAYSPITVKVVSDNNQNCDVYLKADFANATAEMQIDVVAYNDQTVTYNPTATAYTGATLEYTTTPSSKEFVQSSGNVDIRTDGALLPQNIYMPTAHNKKKIGLYGSGGSEFIGTSTSTLELSGTNINLNGAGGTGTAVFKMGGTTTIDSSRNFVGNSFNVPADSKIGTTTSAWGNSNIIGDLDRLLEIGVDDTTAASYPSASGVVFHHGGVSTSAIKYINDSLHNGRFAFDTDDSSFQGLYMNGTQFINGARDLVNIGGITSTYLQTNTSSTDVVIDGGTNQYALRVEQGSRNDNITYGDTLFVRNNYYPTNPIGQQRAQIGLATTDADGDHHRAQIWAERDGGIAAGKLIIATRPSSGVPTPAVTIYSNQRTQMNGTLTTSDGYNVDGGTFRSNYRRDFYVGGQADRFYLVKIRTNGSGDKVRFFRSYNETIGGSSSYWNNGSTTHFGALNLVIDTLNNAWGGHRSVAKGTISHNYTTVCGRVQMGSSSEYPYLYVFLRGNAGGSGALYHVEKEDGHIAASDIIVDYNSYITTADARFNNPYANWDFDIYDYSHHDIKVYENLYVGTTATHSNARVNIEGTLAVRSNDTDSRAIYIRDKSNNVGNIVQFQDYDGNNIWEMVGRSSTFYIYKGTGTGAGYKYQIDSSGNTSIASGNVNIGSGALQMGGTSVIDSSRNIVNGGSVSANSYLYTAADGLRINRAGQNSTIWFTGSVDTNHCLWNGYYGDSPTARGAGNTGFDGMIWNAYRGLRLRGGVGGGTNIILAENSGGSTADHYVRLFASGTERLRTTTGGVNISGQMAATSFTTTDKSFIDGGHSTARLIVRYKHGGADYSANNGILTLWSSEPGITYYGSGIGANVNTSGQYYGREDNNLAYAVYQRFNPATGYAEIWTSNGSAGTIGGQGSWQFSTGISGIANARAGFAVNGTTVIDSGRNLGNIYTVSASAAADIPFSFIKSSNGANTASTMLVENTYGNHSWGITGEYRVAAGSGDRPSILFSNGGNTQTWSIGYGYNDTGYFRIKRDHGRHNGSWGTALMTMDRSGNVTFAGDVTAFSDARLKENIETIKNPINIIKQIRGVSYNWIESGKKSIGVIAQEIEQVPELACLVSENADDGSSEFRQKNVAYGNMVGVLIEAIKEQQSEIDELKELVKKLLEK